MHILALVSSIVGLLAIPLVMVARSPLPMFIGLALSVVGIIVGILSRKEKAGLGGAIIGGVTLLLSLAMFFLFMSRSVPSAAPSPGATVVVPAAPMNK